MRNLFIALAACALSLVIPARADITIGVPKAAHYFACDTEEKAVTVAEAHVKQGFGAARAIFEATCAQFKTPVELFPHKVVWFRELHGGEGVLKVVLMSEWKDGKPATYHYVITISKVIGSGVVGQNKMILYASSHAEDKRVIVEPRIMSGLFCSTVDSLQFVVQNGRSSNEAFHLAMQAVNVEKPVCVSHVKSRVLVSSIKYVQVDTYDNMKLYLYEATVGGFVFGGIPSKIEPSVNLFVYMMEPLHPSHKDTGA